MTAEVFLLAVLTLCAISMRTVQGQLTIAIEPGLLVYKNGTVVDWSCCDDAGNSKDLSVFVDGEEVQYRKASSGMLLNGTCFGGNITIFPSPNGNCFMELKCRSIESYTSKSLEIAFPPPRDLNYMYSSSEIIHIFWEPPDGIVHVQSYNYSVCSDSSNLKQCSNTSELFECFKKSKMSLDVNVSIVVENCVGAPANITIEPGNTKNMDSLVKGLSIAAGGVVIIIILCICFCTVLVYSHHHKKKKRRRRSLGESQLSDKSNPSPKEGLRPHTRGTDAPPPPSTTRPTCASTGSPDVADETSSALPFSCNAEYDQNQKSLISLDVNFCHASNYDHVA